jgi:hypothetical protein
MKMSGYRADVVELRVSFRSSPVPWSDPDHPVYRVLGDCIEITNVMHAIQKCP